MQSTDTKALTIKSIESNSSISVHEWENKIDLIKSQIAVGASDDELQLFFYQCKKTGLDPLSKQIYFQKIGGKAVFITAIDGFRLIAARTEQHAGTDDALFDDEKSPKKASVTVYKVVNGEKHPFTASARWSEYCPPAGRDHMWKKMPCTMLGKCAEALALRKAFPNELGNTYIKEEMDQAQTDSDKKPNIIPPLSSTPKIPPSTNAERSEVFCDACNTELVISKAGTGYYCPNFKVEGSGEHTRFPVAQLKEAREWQKTKDKDAVL